MDFQYFQRICCITMALGIWSRTQAEFFSAVTDMEPLLFTHKKIIDNLEDYIAKDQERLAVLKKHLDCYKKEHVLAMMDISDYLGNPINSYTLIKRLTKDLDFIKKGIADSSVSDYAKNITANNPDVMYPTLDDLTGAVEALTRLQDTYLLDVGELAEGRLIGKNSRDTKDPATTAPMTASDCFEFGLTLYNEKDYHNSLRWMTESLRKLKSEDNLYGTSEGEVVEYISLNHYNLGDIKSALQWVKKLLELAPMHPRASGNVELYQKTIQERELEAIQKEKSGEDVNMKGGQSYIPVSVKNKLTTKYEALCRGDIDIPRKIKKKLKCSYLTKNHPFLKLAPIKMEQIYIEPDVFVFHEVMSDEEIHHIKNLVKPKLARALIADADSGKDIPAKFRISKSAWISNDESDVVKRVAQRTADFTGYSMDTAESLQVANYGIGGHYLPHFDYMKNDLFIDPTGQRIATVLFYMSNVAQGGATVFTELDLTVYPVKNSALFWNNLLPSGEGNTATMHAACPVLRGSKWASNKWIHQVGQELIQPCSINLQQ